MQGSLTEAKVSKKKKKKKLFSSFQAKIILNHADKSKEVIHVRLTKAKFSTSSRADVIGKNFPSLGFM